MSCSQQAIVHHGSSVPRVGIIHPKSPAATVAESPCTKGCSGCRHRWHRQEEVKR